MRLIEIEDIMWLEGHVLMCRGGLSVPTPPAKFDLLWDFRCKPWSIDPCLWNPASFRRIPGLSPRLQFRTPLAKLFILMALAPVSIKRYSQDMIGSYMLDLRWLTPLEGFKDLFSKCPGLQTRGYNHYRFPEQYHRLGHYHSHRDSGRRRCGNDSDTTVTGGWLESHDVELFVMWKGRIDEVITRESRKEGKATWSAVI